MPLQNLERKKVASILLLAAFVVGLFCVASAFLSEHTYAQTAVDQAKVKELEREIKARNDALAELEKEISKYQGQLTATSQRARTLQNTVNELNASINKLTKETQKTLTNIDKTNLTIEKLTIDIKTKEQIIGEHRRALRDIIFQSSQQQSQSLMETILKDTSLAAAFQAIDTGRQVQNSIQDNLDMIYETKRSLEGSVNAKESEKQSLQKYKDQLLDQKKLAESSKGEKSKVLSQTKNEESEYQRLLNQKIAARKAFESELAQLEAALKIAIDPASIPQNGDKVLSWPVASVRITQQFGDTEFSRSNPFVYSGRGHNGIDLAASIGTPIKAAAGGNVIGTGDTDTACPGGSYGKWVMIEHPSGLSTLYAHLSMIKVSPGQAVSNGELIGYSGNTGYSTGPHLHFTVYASQGVKIQSRPSTACGGKVYTMPIADLKAYLNPLLYINQ
jgi:murein DD-endopeptidase MepM/ murein hydrolase activator NlpD